MIATNVGRVAVDAGSADSERLRERTAKSCGPDARYAGVKFRGNNFSGATVARELRLAGESAL